MIYLDNAATTRIEKEVLDSYQALLSAYYANSASSHKLGTSSALLQEKARKQILSLLKLNDDYEVIFTSGATESNNLFLKGVAFAYKNRGKHIITSKIEHPSILNTCKQLEELFGYEVTYLDVNKDGLIDIKELEDSIRKDTIIVSLMLVNNEIGTIMNLKKASEVIKKHPLVFFHSDAVQAIGKIDFDYNLVDAFTISSHKIYGLKGSGALIKKKNIRLASLLNGGSQEGGQRAGTSNYAVNVMLAKTLRLAIENQKERYDYVSKLNKFLYDEFENNDEIILNSNRLGSPYIFNFSLKNKKGPIIAEALSNEEIYVSTVSACSTSKKEAMSDVIYAIYKDEKRAQSSLRISLSKDTTLSELKVFVDKLRNILKNVK